MSPESTHSEKVLHMVSNKLLQYKYETGAPAMVSLGSHTLWQQKKNVTPLTQFREITALSLTILSDISNLDLAADGPPSLEGPSSWCTWQVAGVNPGRQELRVAWGLSRLLQVGLGGVTWSTPVLIVWWSARLLSALEDQAAPQVTAGCGGHTCLPSVTLLSSQRNLGQIGVHRHTNRVHCVLGSYWFFFQRTGIIVFIGLFFWQFLLCVYPRPIYGTNASDCDNSMLFL